MMSSVTSPVMSNDVSCTYTNLTQSQKHQGYPHSHFTVAVLQERKKDEKKTSTQLECLYTDQHSTRVLTQQTSTWLQCSHNSSCLMKLFSVFQYLSTAIIELVMSTRGARQRVE